MLSRMILVALAMVALAGCFVPEPVGYPEPFYLGHGYHGYDRHQHDHHR